MKMESVAAEVLVGEASRDRAFQEELVRSRIRLFRAALLMVGSRDDAEDLTQRAMFKAWRGRGRFRGGSEVYTWLYRILVNLCKDLYKTRARRQRWVERLGTEWVGLQGDPAPTAQDRLEEGERQERLRLALGRLEFGHRQILVLRHFEELGYDEIARLLGCPVGTVRSRLSAARRRLREAYVSHEGAARARGRHEM